MSLHAGYETRVSVKCCLCSSFPFFREKKFKFSYMLRPRWKIHHSTRPTHNIEMPLLSENSRGSHKNSKAHTYDRRLQTFWLTQWGKGIHIWKGNVIHSFGKEKRIRRKQIKTYCRAQKWDISAFVLCVVELLLHQQPSDVAERIARVRGVISSSSSPFIPAYITMSSSYVWKMTFPFSPCLKLSPPLQRRRQRMHRIFIALISLSLLNKKKCFGNLPTLPDEITSSMPS